MKYYQLVGTVDGYKEIIFGSYVRSEVVYEKEAEIDSLKNQGYKAIKIETINVDEKPDLEVYKDQIITAKQVIELALDRDYVTKLDNDLYLINEDQ